MMISGASLALVSLVLWRAIIPCIMDLWACLALPARTLAPLDESPWCSSPCPEQILAQRQCSINTPWPKEPSREKSPFHCSKDNGLAKPLLIAPSLPSAPFLGATCAAAPKCLSLQMHFHTSAPAGPFPWVIPLQPFNITREDADRVTRKG